MQSRRRARRRIAFAAATVATAGLTLPPGQADAAGGVSVRDLTGSLTAADLAQSLAGAGIAIGNVTYTGAATSAGTFTGGVGVVGFGEGVVLSTGSAQVGDHGTYDDATGYSSRSGDADLDRLGAGSTKDATVLAFDVTPDQDTLTFNYVFASEEYNEYVYEDVSDVFGFFVTRSGSTTQQNCAVVADGSDQGSDPDPVSIDTINGGNPVGIGNASNGALFRTNHQGGIPAEPDGFTTVLRCVASVVPHQVNRVKLAISDVGDSLLDSWVFLQAGSIKAADRAPSGSRGPAEASVASGRAGPGYPDGFGGEQGSDGQGIGGNVEEGAVVTVRGTATGPEGRTLTTRWSYTPGPGVDPGATCTYADPTALTTTVSCTDDGVYALTLSATDGRDAHGSSTTNLQVDNAAPRVSLTTPTDTGRVVGGAVEVAATVSDPGANDSRTCAIAWGDRSFSPGVLADGVCTGRHTYEAVGSYDIRVTVTDDDGGSGSDRIDVVVVNAAATDGGGFVFDGDA